MARIKFVKKEPNDEQLPSIKISKMKLRHSRKSKIMLSLSIFLNVMSLGYIILTTIY